MRRAQHRASACVCARASLCSMKYTTVSLMWRHWAFDSWAANAYQHSAIAGTGEAELFDAAEAKGSPCANAFSCVQIWGSNLRTACLLKNTVALGSLSNCVRDVHSACQQCLMFVLACNTASSSRKVHHWNPISEWSGTYASPESEFMGHAKISSRPTHPRTLEELGRARRGCAGRCSPPARNLTPGQPRCPPCV